MLHRDYLLNEDYDIAERNGISRQRVNARVELSGWTVIDAITIPIKKQSNFGAIWNKWRAVAESNRISRECMRSRIKNQGMTAEQAASTPLMETRRRWTAEQRAIMKTNGINSNIVNTRVTQLGWTEEEALNTPRLTEKERAERVRIGTQKYRERRKLNEFNQTI